MNWLSDIQYNCKMATLLIEKRQHGILSPTQGISLRIHLAGCSVCRLYQTQSLLLGAAARKISQKASLDGQFKLDLTLLVHAELKK